MKGKNLNFTRVEKQVVLEKEVSDDQSTVARSGTRTRTPKEEKEKLFNKWARTSNLKVMLPEEYAFENTVSPERGKMGTSDDRVLVEGSVREKRRITV